MNRARLTSGYFVALLLCSASPVAAQVIIGGDKTETAVDVDWSVLERLGPTPNLASMLKAPEPRRSAKEEQAVRVATQAEQNVIFRRLTPNTPTGDAAPHKPAPILHLTADEVKPMPAPIKVQHAPEPAAVKVVSHQDEVKKPAPPSPPALPPIVQPLPLKPAPAVAAVKPAPSTPTPAPAPKPVMAIAAPTPPAVTALITPPPVAPAAPPAPTPVAPPAVASAPPVLPPAMAALTPPPMPIAPPAQQLASLPAPAELPPVHSSSSTPAGDGVIVRGDILTVLFAADDSQLPNGAQTALSQLAKRMSRDDSMTLQLLAYADGDSSNISKARRLSLSRALEVRRVLMDMGVRSTRIEVRALGNKHEGTDPIDRVDALVTSH